MIETRVLRWQSEADVATGVRIYRMEGVLTDSDESSTFLARVRDDLRADPRPLLLDLARVEYVTSTGVGIVVAVYKAAAGRDRTIALAAVSRRDEMLLEITHLSRFVATFGDERAALEHYAADGWRREA